MIVQMLQKIQQANGHLSDSDLEEVSRLTGAPLARVEEVASFFPHFRLWPPPDVVVQVCRDMSCHLRCAGQVVDGLQVGTGKIENAFAPDPPPEPLQRPHLAAQPGTVRIEGVSCLGRCDRAPVICVSRHKAPQIHDHICASTPEQTPEQAVARLRQIISRIAAGEEAPADTDEKHPPSDGYRNWNINVYGRRPDLKPYAAVRQFIEECEAERRQRGLPPSVVAPREYAPALVTEKWLERMDKANVLGMGGEGVPASQKWRKMSKADKDSYSEKDVRYIVANGDESEPGTFKDRELLLRTPNLLVEGVLLAGLITGATHGYIFIRHEYPEQIKKVEAEIRIATRQGCCGTDILGTGRSFPVEVFASPGGYICGEQSALLEAMEDRRAQPRNRPPELTANGLFNMPTVVNNIETLAWAPAAFLEPDGWYRNPGWRLFSISGDLNRPGVYEMPIGAPLGELIDRAGGVKGTLGAVATSGPSGGFLPARLPFDRNGLEGRIDKIKGNPLLEPITKDLLASTDGKIDIRALPLDLNSFRAMSRLLNWRRDFGLGPMTVDLMLGAGLVVYASGRDMVDQAVNATEFLRNESCGKCVPCRIGSEKLVQLGRQWQEQRRSDKAAPLDDTAYSLDYVLNQTSICGLGQVAGRPLISLDVYFQTGPPAPSGPARP